MKKTLKIIAYLLGTIATIALAAFFFIQMSGIPSYDVPLLPLTVEVSPDRVMRGAQLSSVICQHCHIGAEGQLDGKQLDAATSDFGEIHASNITQDPTYGIGTYTDAELYRLLRTGVKKDGKLALPMMIRSRHIADEDIYSIIAFLKSDNPMVQPSVNAIPKYKPNFLVKFLYKIAFEPLPYPETELTVPPVSDQIAYGKYLVDGALICFDCHSAGFDTNDWMNPDKSAGYMGGGNKIFLLGMDEPVVAANITPHKSAGIGTYTEEDFISTVMWGQKPGNKPVTYPMLPYAFLDTTEVLAIYAYLKTVPPIGP